MAPVINSRVIRSSTKILETASPVSAIGESRAGAFVVVRVSLGMEVELLCSTWAKRGVAIANKTVNKWGVYPEIRPNPAENALRCTSIY